MCVCVCACACVHVCVRVSVSNQSYFFKVDVERQFILKLVKKFKINLIFGKCSNCINVMEATIDVK